MFSISASAEDRDRKTLSIHNDIERFCIAVSPSIDEAREIYQLRRLSDLGHEVQVAVDKLEELEYSAKEWVTKREDMINKASESLVAIYTKMPPDAAASQMTNMDEKVAAAILMKLKPKLASSILAEMSAEKAAQLSNIISGKIENKS